MTLEVIDSSSDAVRVRRPTYILVAQELCNFKHDSARCHSLLYIYVYTRIHARYTSTSDNMPTSIGCEATELVAISEASHNAQLGLPACINTRTVLVKRLRAAYPVCSSHAQIAKVYLCAEDILSLLSQSIRESTALSAYGNR